MAAAGAAGAVAVGTERAPAGRDPQSRAISDRVALDRVALDRVASDRVAPDRVGLGWRDELAASIFRHLDQIDVIEVLADSCFHVGKGSIQALRSLAQAKPLTLHGVGMGLASTIPTEPARLARMARLVAQVEPESWSEHLAFVRAGGVEIGHLAAPPRTPASVQGARRNIADATRIVGMPPLLENIATLIDPPASSMSEADWIHQIITGSGCALLLDLHNWHANCVNFGLDPVAALHDLPLAQVSGVHISGGMWIACPPDVKRGPPANTTGQTRRREQTRLLDDHVHDVPPEVFDLLRLLASHAPQPLTVILERDGNYPPFADLLAQLQQARQALAAGRAMAQSWEAVLP